MLITTLPSHHLWEMKRTPAPANVLLTLSISRVRVEFGRSTRFSVGFFCRTGAPPWGGAPIRTALAIFYTGGMTSARLVMYSSLLRPTKVAASSSCSALHLGLHTQMPILAGTGIDSPH